jgi:lipopolysaccharide/colanic/teichoic acid biosynthesis glycosyltransferase
MKRAFDVIASGAGLLALSPLFAVIALAVWLQDRRSPVYVAPRVGLRGRTFRMVKFRSMTVGADRSGVDSTSAGDRRVTPIGAWLRRYKADELLQLWNVFTGDMSLVGPRPQVRRDVDAYTDDERGLLAVRPGMTDFASIVFSDEGDILEGHPDADLAYHQLIRPWKSRLGLVYVRHASVALDVRLIVLTLVAIASRPAALARVRRLLERLGVDQRTLRAASRLEPLVPYPPPGSSAIVMTR